ncbi:MAG: type II toxin-antitoxin system VapC family toxin [Acidimicrobiaceae bacterium]|nr:type II toxin-antitoxin system VapC family toxin [Acidimicrobiaceae bacterium]MDE0608212.1 type II toxin-antitoxin system VapC family toxin [Acidimicrobiaceae bacterium]
MNLLLDTCTLLWWTGGNQLSPISVDAIADPNNRVWVSAATIWEISIKQSIGKLEVRGDLDAAIDEDFEHLPITAAHGRLAGRLPLHHRDPFDRMLIAQAQLQGFTLATRDHNIRKYATTILLS